MKIHKITKALRIENALKKIKERYENQANKIAAEIPNETKCSECRYGRFIKHESVLACGFECKLNPLESVALGLDPKHSDREKALKEG